MATLEERFIQRVGTIYNGNVFREEIPNTINDTQPFIFIRPNTTSQPRTARDQINLILKGKLPNSTGVFTSNSRIKDDDRSYPIVSTVRDATRIYKFLASSKGVEFRLLQSTLQAGNTFVDTRIYNPFQSLINTVPFIHSRRTVDIPFLPPSAIAGTLQQETVFKFKSLVEGFVAGTILPTLGSLNRTNNTNNFLATAGTIGSRFIIGPPDRPESVIFGKWEIIGDITTENTILLRIAKNLNITGPKLYSTQPLKYRGELKTRAFLRKKENVINDFATVFNRYQTLPETIRQNTNFANPYFNGKPVNRPIINQEGQFGEELVPIPEERSDIIDNFNTPRYIDVGAAFSGKPHNILYLAYPFLYTDNKFSYNNKEIVIGDVKPGPSTDNKTKDIIDFYFETEGVSDIDTNPKTAYINAQQGSKVHFRAFISSLKETVKPEHSDNKYLGRVERYISYSGVKRSMSLVFSVAAFSKFEIDMAWMRLNYLTGLAFPIPSDTGFMKPPLFYLTIGNIYNSQPCYLETLDFDLLNETTTFDVDKNKEVPQVVTVNMTVSLIEKTTKQHSSPFYGLVEKYMKKASNEINAKLPQAREV